MPTSPSAFIHITDEMIDDQGQLSCAAAKAMLARVLSAMQAASSGTHYRWGDREITRHDYGSLLSAASFWRAQVAASCGGAQGEHAGFGIMVAVEGGRGCGC